MQYLFLSRHLKSGDSEIPKHVQDTTRDIYSARIARSESTFVYLQTFLMSQSLFYVQLEPKNRNPCNEYISTDL